MGPKPLGIIRFNDFIYKYAINIDISLKPFSFFANAPFKKRVSDPKLGVFIILKYTNIPFKYVI